MLKRHILEIMLKFQMYYQVTRIGNVGNIAAFQIQYPIHKSLE